MKKETKEMLRNFLVGLVVAIVTTVIFNVTLMKVSDIKKDQTVTTLEIGMKISDLKWLARAGKISEEEVEQYNKLARQLDLEGMNQLLDELLEGKEEEYLKEQAELHEKVQSILNK